MSRPGQSVMMPVTGLGFPPQNVARVVVWEWLNEHSRWRPYTATVCHHIENVLKEDARGSVVLGQVDAQLVPYIIDLQSMHQFRQDTGEWTRSPPRPTCQARWRRRRHHRHGRTTILPRGMPKSLSVPEKGAWSCGPANLPIQSPFSSQKRGQPSLVHVRRQFQSGFLVVGPWASSSTSLRLSFLICEMNGL